MEDRDILIYLHSLFLNEEYFDSILDLDNLEDILYMEREDLEKIENSKKRSIDKILESREKDYIKRLVDDINKKTDGVLTIFDEDYPLSLRFIERPPKVLYLKGLPLNLDGVKLGVVGARKNTSYGDYAVDRFVSQLANLNVTIISGMAQGIDSLAHKKALEQDGYTIGVLGNGVDIRFPKSNFRLFEKMYKEGTIISEYPVGTTPLPFYFPERNRIISGLSEGIIVVEAKEKSGSLITARLAAEQGKEVFSVPGNLNSFYSEGTNKLIRDGATPLIDIEDILTAFPELRFKSEDEKEKEYENLTVEESLIISKVKEGYDTIDELVEITDMTVSEISSIITLLEMKGIIKDYSSSGLLIL